MGYRLIAAWLYDLCILFSLAFVFTGICVLLNHGDAIPARSMWLSISLANLAVFYCFLSFYQQGQTIGLRSWRIRLVMPIKRKATWFNSLLLSIAYCCGLLLFLPAMFTPVCQSKRS